MSRLLRLILLILLVLFLLFVGFRCSQLAKEHGAQNLAYTIVPSKDSANQQGMGLSALRHNGSNTNNTDQNTDQNANITLASNIDSSTNVDSQSDNGNTDNADTKIDSDVQQNTDSMDTAPEANADSDTENSIANETQNQADLTADLTAEETSSDANTLVSEEELKQSTGEPSQPSEVDRSPGDKVAAEASAKAKNMLTSDDGTTASDTTNQTAESESNNSLSDSDNSSDTANSTSNDNVSNNDSDSTATTNDAEQTEAEAAPAPAQAVEVSNDSMKKGSAIILQNVTFATGSSRLARSSFKELDKVVTILNKNPDITLEIAGFTDNRGSDEGNKRVSLQRADAVRNRLVSKGIAADRLITQGYGPANPIADNKTSAGRKKNRRVEIYVK